MKIRNAVQPEMVFLDLEAGDAEGALTAVAREFGEHTNLESDLVLKALIEREELGSTSVGNAFAIPHCKLGNLDAIVIALARLKDGVDFGNSGKHDPVRFFFVVLSPPDQPTEHLQVLSQIARILKNAELREELLNAPEPADVVESIQRAADLEGL